MQGGRGAFVVFFIGFVHHLTTVSTFGVKLSLNSFSCVKFSLNSFSRGSQKFVDYVLGIQGIWITVRPLNFANFASGENSRN